MTRLPATDWVEAKQRGMGGDPTFTMIPDRFLDHYMADMTGAEVKAFLYICRRTYGFKKEQDAISFKQLLEGIRRHDGSVVDKGTGLSRAGLSAALEGLEAKGLIIRTRLDKAHQESNVYSVNKYGIDKAGSENRPAPGGSAQAGSETRLARSGGEQASPEIRLASSPDSRFGNQTEASSEIRLAASSEIRPTREKRQKTTQEREIPPGSPPVIPRPAAAAEEEADAEPEFYVPLDGEDQGPVIVELPKEPNFPAGFLEFVTALNQACGRRFEARDQAALRRYTELRRQYERSGGQQGYNHAMLLCVARGAAMDPNRQENRQYQNPISVLRSTIIQDMYQWGAGIVPPPPPRNAIVQTNGQGPASTGRPMNRTETNASRQEELRARAAALRAQQAARGAEGGSR